MNDSAVRVEALKVDRDRYVSLAFCWADLLFEIDQTFNIVFAAGATQAFFGRPQETLVGTNFRDLIAPADLPLVGQLFKQIARTGRTQDESIRVIGAQDNQLWVSLAAYCLSPPDGNLFVGLRKSKPVDKATALSHPRSEGTNLYDSSSFAELAADRLKKIQAAGESAQVTLLSIPGMEALEQRLDLQSNKILTHSVGEFLRANSVGGDSAAKVGTGRFSILHASTTKIAEVVDQIESLTRRADPSGRGAAVESATMTMDADDISEEDLAKGLVYALNKFRETGAGDVTLKDLTANMSSLVGEAVVEVNKFKSVVSQAKFYVALQPILQIHTGEIHHYEALCRFDAKPGESPFKTITFAEETGLIHDFDFAMAKKVVDWLSKFPRNSDKTRVAVNVSGFSIGKPVYIDSLMWLIKDNPWTQGKLMFEITESSRMSDLDTANNFIQTLRGRGYHVCLDDFGAGAASFQYLSVLDVDVVKLDGSAVKNAQRAVKGRAFLSALTELCRRMHVETIAEMVDTEETLEFCRDCGCSYVQGFLFGKPSPDIKDFSPLPHGNLFKRPLKL
ncbi:EAL domain-containing protein [Telmatospirillum sp.]|uniref:EAL domain-containing protein n=1 Tax=Telmatospirillum sp. TaxID=2079197 RepID=UPI0028504CEA|nr:EAL domain-containing protein [Telmatospirillum sp.]MDR3440203.1 EAL domain-containing protein [Telmatospirillum sp.]